MARSLAPPFATSHPPDDGPALPEALAGEPWALHDTRGFLGLIGPVWELRDGLEIRLALTLCEKHENLRGVAQGGVLMTLADRALGMASRLHNDFAPQATVQLGVQFVSPAQIGETVIAHPRLVRKTRRMMFLDGTLTAGDRIVATASGVWVSLDRQGPA
jgi:uncharacterized protein (TIGR00369 family)